MAVTWYPRSTADHDPHRGTLSRGQVDTVCGIRYPVMRFTFQDGVPPDAAKVCPECRPRRYWYLRDPRDPVDAHLAEEATGSDGTVQALCGVSFWPVAVFNVGAPSPSTPPDPRVCAHCQAASR